MSLVSELRKNKNLSDDNLRQILSSDSFDAELFKNADEVRQENYGKDVYLRGLIEFTNYCKNNCYYCGIRRDNKID